MTTEQAPDPSHAIKPTLRAVVIAVAVTVFSFLLAWSWLGSLHSPAPHHVKVAVVAPAQVQGRLQGALNAQAPGGFDLTSYAGEQQAATAVKNGDQAGALVVSVGATGPSFRLLLAGADGPLPPQALTQVFTAAAAGRHAPVTIQDVNPLPNQDLAGDTGFLLVLAVLLPSLAAGVVLGLTARDLSRPLLGLATVGFAVLVGVADTFLAVGGLGTFAGHAYSVAGLIALLALAVTLPVAAAVRRAGPPPLALFALILLGIGVPATGTPAGLGQFTPGFYHWIAPAVPNSATVYALQDTVYFGNHHLTAPITGLSCWVLVGLILLALPAHKPKPAAETVAAPATNQTSVSPA